MQRIMEADHTYEQSQTFVGAVLIFWSGKVMMHLLLRIICHMHTNLSWYDKGIYTLDALGLFVGIALIFRLRKAQTIALIILVGFLVNSIWQHLQPMVSWI